MPARATYDLQRVTRGDSWPGSPVFMLLRRSGETIAATSDGTLDRLDAAAHGLADGALVQVAAGAGVTLSAEAVYHVISADADHFQLAASADGAALELPDAVAHQILPLVARATSLGLARWHVRVDSAEGRVVLRLHSGEGGGLEILDSALWRVRALPRPAGIPVAGDLVWDLETTDTEGLVETLIGGRIQVAPDVTR